jgi:hypothetical protein
MGQIDGHENVMSSKGLVSTMVLPKVGRQSMKLFVDLRQARRYPGARFQEFGTPMNLCSGYLIKLPLRRRQKPGMTAARKFLGSPLHTSGGSGERRIPLACILCAAQTSAAQRGWT